MYDGTVTHADPNCIESWEMDNGMTGYMVYDHDNDSPRNWGREGACVILDRSHAESLDGKDTDSRHDAMRSALAHYGNNLDMVSRYLSIFHDAAAVDTTCATHTRGGWTVYGMVTRAECESAGIDDPKGYIRSELEIYRQYAEGEVYGVIVSDPETGQDRSLWGIYDDWPYNYARTEVAKDLADELLAERS